ncbi:hypothetical protein HRbin07_00611 [bacterium HR07]|nr:hypothetical protein HRbin07_00611 [bacterium HR07]
MLRVPVNVLVVLDDLLLFRRRLDEIGVARIVEQRGLAAPAERVLVFISPRFIQQSTLLQVLYNHRVGVLDELPLSQGKFFRELALQIYGVDEGQLFGLPQLIIFFAEGRSDMDNPCAVFERDEVRRHDAIGVGIVAELVRRLVAHPDQLGSRKRLDDLVRFFDDRLDEILCKNEDLVADFDFGVGELRPHSERDVAGHRPGSGRPD